MRALNSKESNILTTNLSSTECLIQQQELILDVQQLKTLGNLCESLVSTGVLEQNCGISGVVALETLQFCTKWQNWQHELICDVQQLNSLRPSDAIGRQRSGSTLAQVMAWCLTVPSHYLKQCWLIISKVQWHPSESKRYPSHQSLKLAWKLLI